MLRPSRRRRDPLARVAAPSRRLLAVLASVLTVGAAIVPAAGVSAAPRPAPDRSAPGLGPNVLVFTPATPQSEIQARLDALAAQQRDAEFGSARTAVLFAPGSYGSAANPLIFEVGYYTEVAGLGRSPRDVVINGAANVYNRCNADGTNCIALNNFWRSLSNLTINPTGGAGCRANTEFWAVSQASPLRRVNITGSTTFMDYCTAGPQYASGGFVADSALAGSVVNGSQQQFYVRNSTVGGWSNGVWNQVFSGVQGAPAQSFPTPPYTTLPTTPVSREKPYLYLDAEGRYRVFVPAAQRNSAGTSWQNGVEPGRSLSLDEFAVVSPADSAATIDGWLARGKNLLFTPGVYAIDRSLVVRRPGTVVLGLGLATLTAQGGAVPIRVADVPGVDIAGIMIDAGAVNSPTLLQIGSKGGSKGGSQDGARRGGTPSEPTALQDVFFRVGGAQVGRASASLVVNSDNVLLDDLWVWRADHGTGVGWTVNQAANGVVVNGNDVTATGLFVEHFQQDNVVWNGERGTTVFFQNELPYDPPNQAAWRHGNVNGWAAYKVSNRVKTHRLYGASAYIYTNVNPTLRATRAFEVPDRPGVQLSGLTTVSLNNAGTIDFVVNNTGAPATPEKSGQPSTVTAYPGG